MKKIRVAHVLYAFRTGGLEKGIATIINNASPEFEHSILCLSTSGEAERLLLSKVKVYEVHKSAGNSLVFISKLARLLRNLKPHIVHPRNWGGMDAIIAARLAGISYVIQGEHGWEIVDQDGRNTRRLFIRRFLSNFVKEFTCVSENIRQWLINDVCVKRRITRIYNGVDTDVFHPSDGDNKIRRELGTGQSTFVIGVVSRLDPIKDHPSLFQAFRWIKRVFPNAELLVIGDGPERKQLETIASEGISFLGERYDVPEILRALDVFVLPSLNEGISNTILEAMATGLPIIATKVGGNVEIVENEVTGFLVPPRDPEAIESALYKYLNSRELMLLHGNNGRTSVQKSFNVKRMVKSYEKVYLRVARSSVDDKSKLN